MADDPAPVNGRYPRRIYSHAYVPACPVHGAPMEKTRTGAVLVYFACTRPSCPYRGKAPRVQFVPKSL